MTDEELEELKKDIENLRERVVAIENKLSQIQATGSPKQPDPVNPPERQKIAPGGDPIP